jgi:hypothetical protein
MIGLAQIYARCTAKCHNIWRLRTCDPNVLKTYNRGQSTAKAGQVWSQDPMPGRVHVPRNAQRPPCALALLVPKAPNKPSLQTKSP